MHEPFVPLALRKIQRGADTAQRRRDVGVPYPPGAWGSPRPRGARQGNRYKSASNTINWALSDVRATRSGVPACLRGRPARAGRGRERDAGERAAQFGPRTASARLRRHRGDLQGGRRQRGVDRVAQLPALRPRGAAIAAGKRVLLEKPVALDVQQGWETGRGLAGRPACGWPPLPGPLRSGHQRMRQLIADGGLGSLVAVRSLYGMRAPAAGPGADSATPRAGGARRHRRAPHDLMRMLAAR